MNQALAAEQKGLDEIAGPGFRKALEILTKDFAKRPYVERLKHADEVGDVDSTTEAKKHIANIEAWLLVPCIKHYVDDARTRDVVERAAWLGNDETHYVRRWPEKDVKELKSLIGLVMNFIKSSLQHEALMRDMPQGR